MAISKMPVWSKRRWAVLVVWLFTAGIFVYATPAGGEEDDFILGSGRADAAIVRAGPTAAQLSLAPTIGVSLSDYLNTVGRGESRIIDWAALERSIPDDLKEQVPEVRVESVDDNSEQGETVTTFGTPPESPIQMGAMEQHARAFDDPRGESRFTIGKLELIPGVVEINGAVARSSVGVVDNELRRGRGVTEISKLELADGLVTLTGLRWEVLQETGLRETAQGDFTIEGATIAGQGLPILGGGDTVIDTSDAGQAIEAVNSALEPIGLVIDPPRLEERQGLVRVTPLAVRIIDSRVGRQYIAPILAELQPIRAPITEALIEADDQFSTAILVADLTVGVVSGASRLHVELGGVSAFTEGERFDDPFAFTPPAPAPPQVAPSEAFVEEIPAQPAVPGELGTPATEQTRVVTQPGSEQLVRSIPGGRGGAALLVGLISLMAALGMAGADWNRLRVTRDAGPLPGVAS